MRILICVSLSTSGVRFVRSATNIFVSSRPLTSGWLRISTTSNWLWGQRPLASLVWRSLRENNRQQWSIKAKLVFRGNDFWGIVSGDEIKSVEASGGKSDSELHKAQCDFDQSNSRALSIIGVSLSDDILVASDIGLMESAAAARHKFESTYAAKTLLSRLRHHQQFLSLSMHEEEDVQTFLNNVKSTAHESRTSSCELNDEQVVLRILKDYRSRGSR